MADRPLAQEEDRLLVQEEDFPLFMSLLHLWEENRGLVQEPDCGPVPEDDLSMHKKKIFLYKRRSSSSCKSSFWT